MHIVNIFVMMAQLESGCRRAGGRSALIRISLVAGPKTAGTVGFETFLMEMGINVHSLTAGASVVRIRDRRCRSVLVCVCRLLLVTAFPAVAAEPSAYLQATIAAQAHVQNPVGWVVDNLKTVTGPGDGNTWSGGKVLVRAFTNPYYYNLTDKKNQELYPSALWVTTGNELPAWYRDPANSVSASTISLRTAELLGLPTASLQQYNAVVELLVDPAKLIRPTKDPNIAAQPTVLPVDPFAPKPATLSQADYDAYTAWYSANIISSYGDPDPNKQYPWTQLGYTYNWGGDQADLASITGLSEFVVLGTKAGVTSPLETFAVYSIQSYLYRTGADGDGVGDFAVTGPLDTLWAGTKFQPSGSSIAITPGAVVSGGEGIYLSSGGYTVTNDGSIIGPTVQKYYGDGPAGTSVYFRDGGTLINGADGVMTGDAVAIGSHATGQGVQVINHGYLAGTAYAMQTGSGNDSLTVASGGVVRGAVALGSGVDQITIKSGGSWHPVLSTTTGTISQLQAAAITIQNGTSLTPQLSGSGLLPASSNYSLTQGTLSGTFTQLVDRYPLFDFSLDSSGGAIALQVTRVPYRAAVAAVAPDLSGIADTLYQQVATATGDRAELLAAIDTLDSTGAVTGALRQLGPAATAVLPQLSFNADRARLMRLLKHGSDALQRQTADVWSNVRYAALPVAHDADPSLIRTNDQGWTGFTVAAGEWGHQQALGGVPGVRYDGWTTQAGMHKRFSSSLLAGWALGGGQTSVAAHDVGASNMTVDSITPVLFSSAGIGPLKIDLLAGYGYHRYSSTRRIVFGSIDRTASGYFDGHQLSMLISAAYPLQPLPWLTVEPVAGLYGSGLWQDSYTESGAGAADLRVASAASWSLQSHLGPRVRARFDLGGNRLELQLSAFWSHAVDTGNHGLTASFAGTDGGFTITLPRYDQDSLEAACSLQYQVANSARLVADYSLQATGSSMGNRVQIGFEWQF